MRSRSRISLLIRALFAGRSVCLDALCLQAILMVLALSLSFTRAEAQNAGTLWRSSPELARFHLVVPDNAAPLILQAATDFQRLWKLSTRRPISISSVNEGMTNVWLGTQPATSELLADEDISALSPEAFIVRTYTPPRREADRGARKQLLIAGGSDLAVLQGVYTFFADELGVSWLEPGVEYAPKPPEGIRELDIQYHPEFMVREIAPLALYDTGTREFRFGHRLSPRALCPPGRSDFFDGFLSGLSETQPGKDVVGWGSEEGAKRLFEEIRSIASIPESEQNSLRDTCTWEVGRSTIWLVSAMTHLKPVLSAEGQTLNKTEESPVAAILCSLNRVAEMLEQSFPNETHLLHVLLSPATQEPPRNLRPHRNVIIHISTQGCDFSRPYSDPESPDNARFAAVLTRWTRLGSPVYVLDYLANQHDPLLPFPCLDTLQNNILFFARKGVSGVYYAGTTASSAAKIDMLPLKMFLAARFLYNPDLSPEPARKLFLTGYYGAAAPAVEEYLTMLRYALASSATVLHLDDDAAWLSDETLAQAAALFQSILATDLPEPYRRRVNTVGAAVNHCLEQRASSRAGA